MKADAARRVRRGGANALDASELYGPPQTAVFLPLKSCQTLQPGVAATGTATVVAGAAATVATGAVATVVTGAVTAVATSPAATKGAATIPATGPITGGP